MKLRLIPALVVSAVALLVLKLIGLSVDGAYVISPVQTAAAQQSSADINTAQPKAATTSGADAGKPDQPAAPEKAPKGEDAVLPPAFDAFGENGRQPLEIGGSPAERKVLESLSERRRDLDSRERKFDLREQLLKATEDRIDEKIKSLEEAETRIKGLEDQKKKKQEEKLNDVVLMYESMRAKDAARIFSRLDMNILVRVASQMKPRKMADVMAEMEADAAERLTIALASGALRAAEPEMAEAKPELPKIQGN
ncbi:hypothetical protein GR183_02310 [Stappia sp. GBMRC 2046]|uniref:Flagellar motility protein MotE, a chaperone for MotC folding n=1 Tax=Stappia sediminis TaxID=2692190 RepID=A0A7X3LRF9_9HYPH|nr:hypothetical protein [Stappia sediminis]MXN63725.1 hypothetical protein [Stappia sediminis]